MTKRTFIAINFDTPTKLQLAKILNRLPQSSAISPTKIDNLHLTLKFLGEVEENLIPELTQALNQICNHSASLNLNFGKLGVFPNWETPKIIWIQLLSDQLLSLQSAVEHQLKTIMTTRGNKPFKPHLTLARVKTYLPKDLITKLQVLNAQQPPISPSKVTTVDLMVSELTPLGPKYTIVSSSKLKILN